MDKITSDIEKLEKQIKKLKEREDACDDNHVIYIDSLEDDHIQKNKKKKDQDTKKIETIKELDEKDKKEIEEKKETIKIKPITTEEGITKKEYIKYYIILLVLSLFIIGFFLYLIN